MPGMAADPYDVLFSISEGGATWYGAALWEPLPDGRYGITDWDRCSTVLYTRVNEEEKSVKLSEVDKDVAKLVELYHPDIMIISWDTELAFSHLRFEDCSIVVDKPRIDISTTIDNRIEFWDNCELVFNEADTALEMTKPVTVGAQRESVDEPPYPTPGLYISGNYRNYPGSLTFICSTELANNPKWQEGDGYVSQTLMYSDNCEFSVLEQSNINFSFGDATRTGEIDTITGLRNKGIIISQDDLAVGEVGLLIDIKHEETFVDKYNTRLTVHGNFTFSAVANLGSTAYVRRDVTWSGNPNMVWNSENANWSRNGLSYQFKDGDIALFVDTGCGEVTLEGSIAPEQVVVRNSKDHDYTFSGTGKLTGEMNLTKDGEGTLTINTANDYSGCTAVYNGTLAVGENGSLGSGDFYVRENGVLQFSKTTLKQVWVSKIDNSELRSQYFESAPYGKMIDVTLGTEDVTIDDTTVTYDTIIGKGKGISSISCLNITSDANLMIKNLTIEASSDFMKNFKTMIPPHTEIHVGDHVITLQDVDIDVTNLDYRLVEDGYLFDLKSLINCNLEMENVTIDASGLDLDLAPDQKITVDFGDDVFIKDAKDLRLLLGNNISQEIRLAEQNGQMIFTSLVPRDDSYGGAVPEPTTGTLSLLALAGLCARRRRK